MAGKYSAAPDVARLAHDLIREHHGHLREASIAYLFREGTWVSKGRPQLGQAVKASDRDKELHGHDFLLIVSWDAWFDLDGSRRRALVDHELCHMAQGEPDKEGNPTWCIVGHDYEDFAAVIRRHGLWTEGVELFARVARPAKRPEQMSILDEAEDSDAADEDEERKAS